MVLRVAQLSAGYGAISVLADVSFALGAGEHVGILGRNGAGKTTLLRVIMGLLPATSGSVELDGVAVAGSPPHRIARRGIAYVPQGRGIFPKLTVRENLLAGTRAAAGKAGIDERVFTYFPILAERLGQTGGTLSGGQQQMLAIARALCGAPKVLLLDEPSEGIQPSVVQELETLLPLIARERGISVLVVEQNIDLAASLASRFLFLDKGRLVHECGRGELDDGEAVHRYLAL